MIAIDELEGMALIDAIRDAMYERELIKVERGEKNWHVHHVEIAAPFLYEKLMQALCRHFPTWLPCFITHRRDPDGQEPGRLDKRVPARIDGIPVYPNFDLDAGTIIVR